RRDTGPRRSDAIQDPRPGASRPGARLGGTPPTGARARGSQEITHLFPEPERQAFVGPHAEWRSVLETLRGRPARRCEQHVVQSERDAVVAAAFHLMVAAVVGRRDQDAVEYSERVWMCGVLKDLHEGVEDQVDL